MKRCKEASTAQHVMFVCSSRCRSLLGFDWTPKQKTNKNFSATIEKPKRQTAEVVLLHHFGGGTRRWTPSGSDSLGTRHQQRNWRWVVRSFNTSFSLHKHVARRAAVFLSTRTYLRLSAFCQPVAWCLRARVLTWSPCYHREQSLFGSYVFLMSCSDLLLCTIVTMTLTYPLCSGRYRPEWLWLAALKWLCGERTRKREASFLYLWT